MKIVVTKRSEDYHAYLENRSEIWGCGRSPDEAIGSLIRCHPECLNLTIEYK